MIRFLFKYGALIFIVNTIFLSIEQTYNLGNQLFFLLMFVFGIILFFNPSQIKVVVFHKAFSFFLFLNIINIVYFLFFHEITDLEALKYLFARGMQFSIISFSVYYHYDYYVNKFLTHLAYIICFLLMIGFIVYSDPFSLRYSGLFWNPNAFASFAVIAFSILLIKIKDKNNFTIFLLSMCIILALASGSRGVLVALILAYLIQYGFSTRNIIYGVIGVAIYLLVANLQYQTSFNRFASQDLLSDRIMQYKYAILSIQNNLFVGYGLDKYSYIDKDLIPLFLKSKIIGAHNGYLAILTQYGVVIGSVVLYIIIRKAIILSIFFYANLRQYKIYVFIIIYTLVAASYESLIVGINEFQTLLFWLALCVLSFSYFKSSFNES